MCAQIFILRARETRDHGGTDGATKDLSALVSNRVTNQLKVMYIVHSITIDGARERTALGERPTPAR